MGFGDLKGSFWLGLDKLNCLTQYFKMNLTIEMYKNSTDEKYYVVYGGFGVGNESTNYKLSLGRKIFGNLDDKSVLHNGQMFSTSDSNNCFNKTFFDCGYKYKGGWWMNNCYEFCLTCESLLETNYMTKIDGQTKYNHFDRINVTISLP